MTSFSLNALCIPIKGFNRSIIYDLNRNDYYFISNDLYKAISKSNFFISKFDNYFKKLFLDNEIIYNSSNLNIKNFRKLDFSYFSPYNIEVLVLDFEIDHIIINKIYSDYVNNLTLIIDDIFDTESIINKISTINSIIHFESLTMVFKKESYIANVDFNILQSISELFEIIIFSSNNINIEVKYNLIFKRYSFDIDYFNNNVFSNRFSVNINTFLISKNYNLYYFKKIFIGKDNILYHDYKKEIPVDINFIRKIDKTFINEIKKDNILVCKNCEFRNMCIDPRVPIKFGNSYYFENECSYNPYISKWSDEEGYKNLKDSGVEITNDGKVKINRKKLKASFEVAWAE
jgi:hypothetical protein